MKYKNPRMHAGNKQKSFYTYIPLKLNEHILSAASYSTRLRVGVSISSFTIALWEIKWVRLQQFPCPSLEASEIYFPQTVRKMLLFFFLNLISPCKSGVPEIKLRFQLTTTWISSKYWSLVQLAGSAWTLLVCLLPVLILNKLFDFFEIISLEYLKTSSSS